MLDEIPFDEEDEFFDALEQADNEDDLDPCSGTSAFI